MSTLNKEQEDAASFLNGVAAVIAVPGSGKTRTMMERIGRLVNEHQIAPESILGLTFTRNAADEMRHRLSGVLGDKAQRVMLSTIHSFCNFVLKEDGRIFHILSGKYQIVFLRAMMKKLKIKDISIGMALREISLAKNNLITPEELRDLYDGDKTMQKVADVYALYDEEKQKKLLMDFDDLLIEVCRMLREDEYIRDKYRTAFQHILVDEFQDTNPAQMEILKLLINGNGNSSFWTCGDDWQSIYAFTGASVGNILRFKEIFPESVQYILNLNYRSTPQILKGCQNLISHNTRQIDKTLRTENANGDDIVVLECANEEHEALSIVNEIQDLVERRGYQHKDIAVLYRANFQSRIIEEVFTQHKVPHFIEAGISFYNRLEVKTLLDYLRVIHDPSTVEADEAMTSILNVPNRYIGRKFIKDLEEYAASEDKHLYEALRTFPVDAPYLRKNVKDFQKLLDPLIKDADTLEPAETISMLREILDYDSYITDDDIPTPDDQKIQNINQLHLAATRFKSIERFLEYTDTFSDDSVNDKNGVRLMTIHKSKGMEYPAVFVVGLVENILPSKRGDTEEERRICFVGISRAMKHLYLSYYYSCLNGQQATKSIFLDEIMGKK